MPQLIDLHPLTPEEIRCVQTHVHHAKRVLEGWLQTPPLERDNNILPDLITGLENLLTDFRAYELDMPPNIFVRNEIDLQHILDDLAHIQDNLALLVGPGIAPPLRTWVRSPSGQWKIHCDEELLCELCQDKHTDHEIALIFGVSVRTVKRSRKALGITKRAIPDMADDKLRGWIRWFLRRGGQEEGYQAVWDGLSMIGVRVQRERVRLMLKETEFERLNVIGGRLSAQPVRRVYRVRWANGLWHSDGHHKLILWKFVIHGCIDGHSRMITFLEVNDNNRAESVTAAFRNAVNGFGWPN